MPSFRERLTSATRVLLGREERSVPAPFAGIYQGWGKPALFAPKDSLDAYGDNVWLYRAVLSISMEIARTKFKLRTTTKDGEYKYLTSHQALDTLAKPQPIKGGKSMLTGMDLKLLLGMHLMLNGEAFWLLNDRRRVNGAPTRVDVLLSQYVYEKIAESGDLTSYVYRLPQKELELDPMDVVHFKLPDPGDMYRGHSPTQGIRYSLDTAQKADILNAKRLDNFGVPAGTLETELKPSDTERHKLLEQFKQMYGGPANSGKVAILPNGFKFNPVQLSNQDMQFVEGKNVVRDEILANYGVGLEILGRTESQTRANAEAAIFVFMKFGVLPFLEKICDSLNNDYLITFPGTENLEFTFDDPVPENTEDKRATADNLFNGGALTPNERRKMFGLEPLDLPGMDTPYVPIGMMPVDDPLGSTQTNP
jgi:HK97 family phage portal protein